MDKGVEKEKGEKKNEPNKNNYNIFVPLFLFPRPSTRGQPAEETDFYFYWLKKGLT